jgi:hypothetical protein
MEGGCGYVACGGTEVKTLRTLRTEKQTMSLPAEWGAASGESLDGTKQRKEMCVSLYHDKAPKRGGPTLLEAGYS